MSRDATTTRYPLSRQLTMTCINEAAGQDMLRYTIPAAWRISGHVDAEALRAALNDLVFRHESLRTLVTCGCEDDEPGYQAVRPAEPVDFAEHLLAHEAGRSRDDAAEEVLAELFTQTMSRDANPLLRAALHRFDDSDSVLTLLVHHIAADATSISVLRRDLGALYEARTNGTVTELPTVRQYGEYAQWQQEQAGSRAQATMAYWAKNLLEAEVFAPPADHPADEARSSGAFGSATVELDALEMDAVRALARGERAFTWHVLVSAAALLASDLTGTTSPAVMAIRATRDHEQFSRTVGPFVDALPLRVGLEGCVTFRDVVLRARSTCLRAYESPLPNCDLVRSFPDFLAPNASPLKVPLFMNYLPTITPSEDISLAGGAQRIRFRDELPMDHGGICVLGMWQLPSGGLRVQLEYPPDRLEATTAQQWVTSYGELVRRIARTPDEAWRARPDDVRMP